MGTPQYIKFTKTSMQTPTTATEGRPKKKRRTSDETNQITNDINKFIVLEFHVLYLVGLFVAEIHHKRF
jgi:hypothetical protein